METKPTTPTTIKKPLELLTEQVVTAWPDPVPQPGDPGEPIRHGDPGEWTVTAPPTPYGSYARIDWTDHHDRPGVWVLREDTAVTVELTESELQARAGRIITSLASANLPEIYCWEIAEGRIEARLSAALLDADQIHARMDTWRDHLGAAEVTSEPADRYMRLAVTALLDGIPVEVRASVYSRTKAEGTTDAETGQTDDAPAEVAR